MAAAAAAAADRPTENVKHYISHFFFKVDDILMINLCDIMPKLICQLDKFGQVSDPKGTHLVLQLLCTVNSFTVVALRGSFY